MTDWGGHWRGARRGSLRSIDYSCKQYFPVYLIFSIAFLNYQSIRFAYYAFYGSCIIILPHFWAPFRPMALGGIAAKSVATRPQAVVAPDSISSATETCQWIWPDAYLWYKIHNYLVLNYKIRQRQPSTYWRSPSTSLRFLCGLEYPWTIIFHEQLHLWK